jgi:uncharacterized membrane protein YfcA
MDPYILLFLGAIVIGIMAVVFGGTLFISLPLIQSLFPGLGYGQYIGNLKVGSLFRGLASTWSTWKQIDFKHCLTVIFPFIMGSILGTMSIAKLNESYLLYAVIIAILFSELSPKLARFINKKTQLLFSIILGLYMGFIGAGISVMLVALLRTAFPKSEQIIFVKIQARFIEAIGTIVVVIAHILYGNILFPMWLFWSLGSLIGGHLGGTFLKKTVHISAKAQRIYLVIVYVIALIPQLVKLV